MKKFNSAILANMLTSKRLPTDGLIVVDRGAEYTNMYYAVFHEEDTPDVFYRVQGLWSNFNRSFSFMDLQGGFQHHSTPTENEIECREVEAIEEIVIRYKYKN